jgi:hypothetical protein
MQFDEKIVSALPRDQRHMSTIHRSSDRSTTVPNMNELISTQKRGASSPFLPLLPFLPA